MATQYLEPDEGDEKAALYSIHTIFNGIKYICKKYGPQCYKFTRISVVTLNEVIRPFTSKWHKYIVNEEFYDKREEFMSELQLKLREFTNLLAEMCGIEDITEVTLQVK